MVRSWMGHAIRFGIGALAVWLLIGTGALQPALLGAAIAKHPVLYGLAFLLYLGPLQALACGRWYWLLRTAKVRITLRETVRLHLMGLFFSGFLPGGTGGDLVKGWYLLKGRPKPEAAAALGTLVADRVTGLFGLVALAATANLVNAGIWRSSPVLAAQSVFILSLAAGTIVLTLVYLSPWTPRWLPSAASAPSLSSLSASPVAENPPRGFLAEFARTLGFLRGTPGVFLGAVGLSVLVHFCLVVVYALCAGALDVSLPFRLHAYVGPTLTLANGIPVSPAGLGVGEAAGMVLYKAVGVSHSQAEIPALVHTISLMLALLCAPAYFLRRRR